MTTAARCSNKDCNAPLLSGFERNKGRCTACLHKTSSSTLGQAKPPQPKRKPEPQEVYQIEQEVYLDTQANSATLSFKVPANLRAKLDTHVATLGTTKGEFLRSLLENALP